MLQGARFFEQVRGAANDHGLMGAAELRGGGFVDVQRRKIGTADDEQGRASNRRQAVAGEVGPAAPGDDGIHVVLGRGGDPQGRASTGARTEEPERKMAKLVVGTNPGRDPLKPLGEQLGIEDEGPVRGFALSEEIEEQRRHSRFGEATSDRAIAHAVAAAPAAVRENHDARSAVGNLE